MKLEIFEIRFDVPRGVYTAGDQVKGNVVLRLRNPMKVRSKFFSVCACVTLDFCVCVCACIHACMCVSVCVCVCMCVYIDRYAMSFSVWMHTFVFVQVIACMTSPKRAVVLWTA